MRRLLPYAAVVWGGLTIVLFLLRGFASTGDGYYRGGQFFGLLFAVALVVAGGQEISSNHLRKNRYLPWLMGILAVMIAIAVAIPLLLPRHYPASIRAGFLDGCEAHGTSAAWCGCALNWFESHKSLAQFAAVDAEMRATGAIPSDVSQGITSSCPR